MPISPIEYPTDFVVSNASFYRVPSVEALSKRNSPGAVILGEYYTADCRLITT